MVRLSSNKSPSSALGLVLLVVFIVFVIGEALVRTNSEQVKIAREYDSGRVEFLARQVIRGDFSIARILDLIRWARVADGSFRIHYYANVYHCLAERPDVLLRASVDNLEVLNVLVKTDEIGEDCYRDWYGRVPSVLVLKADAAKKKLKQFEPIK